jgi:hypothetical protein
MCRYLIINQPIVTYLAGQLVHFPMFILCLGLSQIGIPNIIILYLINFNILTSIDFFTDLYLILKLIIQKETLFI